MSLFKQLLLAICLFLLVAFTGSFVVSLESSREQQVNQLRSHAQDAATALALALTPHVDDPAMTELMVSSIFDSGYFESIRVRDLQNGQLLVERTGAPDAQAAGVPQWFVGLIGLPATGGDAIISRGWTQAAQVEVVSHPMFAIARLWHSTLGSLGWLLLCGLLSAVLGALLLRRQLKPLDYMVEQSQAIARREFLSLPELPSTPELRRVVLAMNQMVDKLKALFQEQAERSEKLRDEAYLDSLTGLGNRRYFDMQLSSRLSDEDARSGHLLLVRVDDLAGLNQRIGGLRTDQLLCALATQLKMLAAPGQLLARSRGGEFSLLAPGLQQEPAQQLAGQLHMALSQLQATGEGDAGLCMQVALVAYSAGDTPQQLLLRADEALTRARGQGEAIALCRGAGSVLLDDAEDSHGWYQRLEQALQERLFSAHFQPVVDCREPSQILHYKVLARLPGSQAGETLPAGRFLPWLERFGWSARLDLLMLEQALQHTLQHGQPLALNLSAALLRDDRLLEQAFALLQKQPAQARHLVLELEEGQLPDASVLEQLVQRLRALGYALSITHFGGRFSMIGNLARLGLAYLKIDGSFIRAIDQESDKRLFLEAMQRAAHSIDLPLIAERVENPGEWQVLQAMGIAGVQGQLFGTPVAWS